MTASSDKNEIQTKSSKNMYQATLSQTLGVPSVIQFKKQLNSIHFVIGTDIYNLIVKFNLIYLKLPSDQHSKCFYYVYVF